MLIFSIQAVVTFQCLNAEDCNCKEVKDLHQD